MTEKQQINWVDMVVASPKPIAEFYEVVIGYSLKPFDEGNGRISYSLLDGNSKEAFGICDKNSFPNWTGGWVLYIEVDDFEERVARIEEHGGEIVGHWPGEEGRRGECLFRDPSGAGVMLQDATKPRQSG